MRVYVDLTPEDVAMMRAIAEGVSSTCSAKKWQVTGGRSSRYSGSTPEQLALRKRFERLVVLEVVEHSRNGHCWLTKKGKQALDG